MKHNKKIIKRTNKNQIKNQIKNFIKNKSIITTKKNTKCFIKYFRKKNKYTKISIKKKKLRKGDYSILFEIKII
ncbi:MAG: hypothetical protein AAYR31_00665 [Candidatus Vidania fulgoroideorum]